MRAGSLWQKLETSSASPAAAPADIVFGLGTRPAADVVRVLWPAGIVQAEPIGADTPRSRDLEVVELDRKPSSCPYLYTWNGERFEFVTDFMGGGEMGYQHAPGVYSTPDPEEFVRIRGERLRAAQRPLRAARHQRARGDAVPRSPALVAVDHPARCEVLPARGPAFVAAVPRLQLETAARSTAGPAARSTTPGAT